MTLPFYLVNAFTLPTSPHSGNQASVVLLPINHPKESNDEWKQLIARDFNFAETAFVQERSDGKYGLRWFTPAVEVNLCGHATLASATALFHLNPSVDKLVFVTRWAGELVAVRGESVKAGSMDVTISLPALSGDKVSELLSTQTKERCDEVEKVVRVAIPGLKDVGLVKNIFNFVWGGEASVIVELDEEVDIAALKVDSKAFLAISKGLIIVTQPRPAESTAGRLAIKSRVFGPGVGIDEDPVTGAAHTFLTSYYLSPPIFGRLPSDITSGSGPKDMVVDAYQMSERQGRLECKLEGEDRVSLTGKGTIWGKGDVEA